MNFIKTYIKRFSKKQRWALGIFLLISLLSSFIANEKFIVGKSSNGFGFFINAQEGNSGLRTLIPYSYNTIDRVNRKVGPFDHQEVKSLYYRHWLGTDSLGRDVLAGLINGSNIALKVGLFTVLISLIIGIFLGYLSGYYGDSGAQLKRSLFILWLAITLILWFYGFYNEGVLSFILFAIPFVLLIWILQNSTGLNRNQVGFPFDTIVFRMIETMNALPSLFIILILLSILNKPSIWNVILVIGILRWPVVARHLRAEILKIKKEDYIDSAKTLGLSDWKIFINHVFPMAASPLIIVSAFGFSVAVLFESTLSFLGIGVPLDQVTWGSLIKDARYNFDAWWLAVFPGVLIYGLVYLFNSIGDTLNEKIRGI